ncbi:MAG: hypothetical protein LC790_13355 [Actinobacteria bacterium]|nr:hypothetical protein [Actinomycetota bacterium]
MAVLRFTRGGAVWVSRLSSLRLARRAGRSDDSRVRADQPPGGVLDFTRPS